MLVTDSALQEQGTGVSDKRVFDRDGRKRIIETEWTLEQTIAEIEYLDRTFAVLDTRPLSLSDLAAANRRHDDMLAHSPWFRLWQRYGICCRAESPTPRLGEIDSQTSTRNNKN
jgi:hypothetical protein